MKKLFFILLLGLGFSQTELETRLYEIDLNGMPTDWDYSVQYIDIEDFLGFDIDYAIIDIVYINTAQSTDYSLEARATHQDDLSNGSASGYSIIEVDNVGAMTINTNAITITPYHPYLKLDIYDFSGSMSFYITTEFPQEDTGYIEDGFEFCLNEGANLVSYPCDNPVPVEDALPNGIENFVTSIIGEGQATSYSDALGWIGSLSSFNEGSGYWFKSNSSVCFQYDCVAN